MTLVIPPRKINTQTAQSPLKPGIFIPSKSVLQQEKNKKKIKIATLPAFLGGGAYNIAIGDSNRLILTPREYGTSKAEAGVERHHIIPVEFGGNDTLDNDIKKLPVKTHARITKAEKVISDDYHNGKITLGNARLQMMGLLQKELDAQQGIKQGTAANLLGGIKDMFIHPIESFKKAVKTNPQTTQAVKDIYQSTKRTTPDIKKTVTDYIKSIYETDKNAIDKVHKLFTTKGTKSEKVGQALEATTASAGVVFSPITAAFSASKNLPVLGGIASMINLPLAAVGDSLTNISNEGLNALVATDNMDKQVAENIRNGVNEVVSLAGQIVVAGAMFKGKALETKKAELETKYGKTDAETILKKAEEMAKKDLAEKAKIEHLEIPERKIKVKEKIKEFDIKRKSEQLGEPILQVGGNKVAIKLPKNLTETQRAKLFDEVGTIKDFGKQPIHIRQSKILETPEGKNLEVMTLSKAIKKFEEVNKLVRDIGLNVVNGKVQQPIEYKPIKETRINRSGNEVASVAKSIETKAIENGLVEGGFDSLASFERTTMKDQAKLAKETIKNIDNARAIVRGENPLPQELNGISLVKAMEEVIKKTKDADLAYELANSPLVEQVSLAAQELSLTRGRTKDSATRAIDRVKKTREKKAGKATKEKNKIKKDIKKETKKVNLSKEDLKWEKFLDEIKC